MALNYGSSFADKWAGVNPDQLQAYWIEELGQFNAIAIGAALKALDTHPFPPSLPEFKALCKAYHRPPEAPRLEAKPATPEEAAAALKNLQRITGLSLERGPTDYKKCWHEIQEGWRNGTYKSRYGYLLSCQVLGVEPIPAPVRAANKDAACAD